MDNNNLRERVERHKIYPEDELYKAFETYCHLAKNLYNAANFQIRKSFFTEGKSIKYTELDKLMKQLEKEENIMTDKNKDYKLMPTAASAQQTLRRLNNDWKSYEEAIKDWKLNPTKYTGKPKIPKYKRKDGKDILILTNQCCKISYGKLSFPWTAKYKIKTNIKAFQQVRILPRCKHFIVEIVYLQETEELKEDNNRYMSIDIGLDNFATIVNNVGKQPIVINGKGLKSINKKYNKDISHYREIAKRMNKLDYTNRMNKLTMKRNNIVENFIHKASKFTVDKALELDCNTIVIGNNKDWKRESKMSKKVNQSFVGLPHQEYIKKVIYKAENVGIKVILTEEAYTSGTSFLDNELPIKNNYDKSRRVKRGLFISNTGKLINADVNGAYQIMRKVFPNAKADGIEDIGLYPVRVNIQELK